MEGFLKIGLLSTDLKFRKELELVISVCKGCSLCKFSSSDRIEATRRMFKNSDVIIIDLDTIDYKVLFGNFSSEIKNIVGVGGSNKFLGTYLDFGIKTYLNNKYAYKEILDMIISPKGNNALIFDHILSYRSKTTVAVEVGLTLRETEVIKELGMSLSYNQISKKLIISRETVKSHLEKIYSKLEVGSRFEAVEKARTVGII